MKNKALVALPISLLFLAGLVLLVILLRKGRESDVARLEAPQGASGSAVPGTMEEKAASLEPAPEKDAEATKATEAVDARVDEGPPLLRGLVTGEGLPIAGASVRLFGVKRVEEALRRLEEAVSGSADPIPEIPRIIGIIRDELGALKSSAILSRTGDDGVYEFRGIEPDSYIVLTLADDWLFRYGDVASLEAGVTRTLDMALERGTSIAGRVVDASGRGLPGITVVAEFRPAGTAGMGKFIRRLLRLVNGEFLRGPFETVTADDGSFTCSSLLPGIYDLAALSPSGIEARLESVESGSQDALVYLGKAASVRGAFVDASGLPARGAVFLLEREDDGVKLEGPMAMWGGVVGALERELGEKPRKFEAGERGEFQVKALAAGKYKLSVPGAGWLPLTRQITLDWGEALDLGTLALDRGESLSGTVRDEDQKPLVGARVRLSPSNVSFFNMGAVAADIVSGEKTAMTGSSGEFHISGLLEGDYRLVANARGYVPEAMKKVPSGDTVSLVLRRGSTVEGRVLEAGDGERPIPGARVRSGPSVATADAEGRFVLEGLTTENPDLNPFAGMGPEQATEPDSKKARVRATAPGFIRAEVATDLGPEPVEVELRLAKAPEIRGRVLDPDGQPLPGTLARLTIHVGEEGQFFEDFFDRTLLFGAAGVTDLEGKFRFQTYRQAGDWQKMQVVADHPLHARGMSGPIEIAEGGEPPAEVEIRLERAASIRGTVTDGKEPVRGAAVRLRKKPRRTGGPDMGAMLSMFGMPKGGSIVYTRDEGKFAHEKVLPGEYILVAEASGYGDSPQAEVTIAAGDERTLTLALERGGEILGVVVDAAAAPIPEVRVRALVEPPDGTEATQGSEAQMYQAQKVFGGAFRSTRTDGDGRFALKGLPSSTTYTLAASRSGYTGAEITKVGLEGNEQRIVLQRAAALRGAVVDAANGEPIRRFRIALVAGGPSLDLRRGLPRDERDHADPEGRFGREDLEPGKKFVIASSPGFAPARAEVLLEAGLTTEVELALAQAGRILGAVVDLETGAPVAGAQVALSEESDRPEEPEGEERPGRKRRESRTEKREGGEDVDEDGQAMGEHFLEAYMGESVRSGNDGSFIIEGAPAEPCMLVASHPEYIPEARKGILVGPGQEAQARLALRKGLVCAGTLESKSGENLAGRFVFIRGTGDENRHVRKSTIAGADGKFRIGGLEKGSYRIVVTGGGNSGGDPGSMTKMDVELRSDVKDLAIALVEASE